ncbi:agip144 [Agrotis ipsilon multiple nucleopolyhedrovirus]|uniref:Uncharacterized protein n=1 Tax=Agrotis ipsilon multiple nucleopolyhedrovirus TaxID=208013 RepID=B6D658_9ABAC|nr:agip144 [Agrotis ipsilon multiple nucleopolyhedrovirus]ACI28845.1 unknown [Agrotis ipsilon multiple nucleopolyhedrovirus]
MLHFGAVYIDVVESEHLKLLCESKNFIRNKFIVPFNAECIVVVESRHLIKSKNIFFVS